MTDYTKAKSAAGFTLIEVVVALAILSWVLGSTLYVVQQYADERLKLRQGFFATQISWNRLLERYQDAQGWVPTTDRSTRQTKGVARQNEQSWRWEMKIKAAMGEDLYRYEALTGPEDSDRSSGSLALYLVGEPVR